MILLVQLDLGLRILQIVAGHAFPSALAGWRCSLPPDRSWTRRRKCYRALCSMTQCYQDSLGDFPDHRRKRGIERQRDGGRARVRDRWLGLRRRRRGWLGFTRARRDRGRCQHLGEQVRARVALPLSADWMVAHQLRRLEWLLQNRVAAGALGLFFVEWLQQPGGEDHANMPQFRIVLNVPA